MDSDPGQVSQTDYKCLGHGVSSEGTPLATTHQPQCHLPCCRGANPGVSASLGSSGTPFRKPTVPIPGCHFFCPLSPHTLCHSASSARLRQSAQNPHLSRLPFHPQFCAEDGTFGVRQSWAPGLTTSTLAFTGSFTESLLPHL